MPPSPLDDILCKLYFSQLDLNVLPLAMHIQKFPAMYLEYIPFLRSIVKHNNYVNYNYLF